MTFKHYLEEEDDKPYFTTNSLGYYYDKMEGFAEKVEQAAKILNVTKEEVEKNITAYIEQNKNELDQRLADWDGKLETFDSSIENLLLEWVDDGTLANVIDSTLIDQKVAPLALQLTEKVGGQVKLKPEDLSNEALALVTGNGTVNVLSIPQEGSVTPTKTTFMGKSKNLFNGIYSPIVMVLMGAGGSEALRWRGLVAGEKQTTAIIPIEAGKTYTVKLKDTEMNDVFKLGILNNAPDLANINNVIVDKTVSYNDTLKQFTFTNTAEGRFLLVYVSSIGNKPRLQVEEGVNGTPYVEHYVLKGDNLNIPQVRPDGLDDSTLQLIDTMADAKVKERLTKGTPNIVSLFTGKLNSQVLPATSLNTVGVDTVNYKVGNEGLKVNVGNAGGHQVDFTPPPFSLPPTSVIGAWVHVEDVTKITSMAINLYLNAELNTQSHFNANAIGGLKNGWNLLRWSVPNISNPFKPNNTIHRIRVTGGSNAPTSYTIGHIWAECPPKAQILFIQDGAEAEFLNTGYPDLKARNIPVTWGLAPGRIGVTNHITESQIYELSLENNNSMSFHSWNVGVTNNMTDEQLRDDSLKGINWLRQRGYNGGIFRAAFTQNLAPAADSVKNMYLAMPMYTGGAGKMEAFPFINQFDVKRYSVHAYNADPLALPAMFQQMKDHHCLFVVYTHLVSNSGNTVDVSLERWAQFLSLIDAGTLEDWLEGVTFEQLIERSGISNRPGNRGWVRELFEEYGSYANLKLRE